MAKNAVCEIFLVIDEDGDYEIGTTPEKAVERFEEEMRPINECEAVRIVKLKLTCPAPQVVTLSATIPAPKEIEIPFALVVEES